MNKPKELEKGISDMVGVFTDPIIVYPGGWQDSIPDWVKERITLERLIMEMMVHRGAEPTGTDAEALAYMMPACMEFPLSHDWTEIYLYLGTKVSSTAGKEVPEDIHKDSLREDQMRDLNQLKAWLYNKRIEVRLERDRARRRQEKEEETQHRRELQPALFDLQ